MAGPGINLATTRDGEAYNKLQRPPQDYLASTAPPLPPSKPLQVDAYSSLSNKRKRDAFLTPGQKRSRLAQAKADGTNSLRRGAGRERVRNADCGMQVTLPGLDDEGLFSDDSTGDAIAYLRTVRSEASAIPHLLLGSTSPQHGHASDDAAVDVIFEQGACIAMDGQVDADVTEGNYDALVPQDRYYELLLKRFYDFQGTLAKACQDFDATRSEISVTTATPRTQRAWCDMFERQPPNLDLLGSLDEAAIYGGLQSCASSMNIATSISPKQSYWAWSLLALVPDVGTLNYEKLGRIREIGQSAGLAAARLRNGNGQGLCAGNDGHPRANGTGIVDTEADISDAEMSISGDEGEVLDDTEGSDLARAQAEIRTQLGDRLVHPPLFSPQRATNSRRPTAADHGARGGNGSKGRTQRACSPILPSQTSSIQEKSAKESSHHQGQRGGSAGGVTDLNTSVTIDMILTIVAECFGQKDLLAYRRRW